MVEMRLSTNNILTRKPDNGSLGPDNGSSGQKCWPRFFGAVIMGATVLSPVTLLAREPPSSAVLLDDTNALIRKLEQGTPDSLVRKIIELDAQKRIEEINTQLRRLIAYAGSAVILSNDDIAHAFVQNPKRITDALERVLKYVHLYGGERDQKTRDLTLSVLDDRTVGRLFAKHPYSFASIALSARTYAWMAFEVLSDEKLAALFEAHPHEFVMIARVARTDAYSDFELLKDERLVKVFQASPQTYSGIYRYDDDKRRDILSGIQKGTATLAQVVVASISQYDPVAIELGRPIDDVSTETERRGSVKRLQDEEVLGLLCSNPELFSQATNRILFERLRAIMGNAYGPAQVQKQFNLNEVQLRNMVFRALNHGRFADLISPENREADVRLLSEIIVGNQLSKTGIYSDYFDESYFYILANGIENAAVSLVGLQDTVTSRRDYLQSKKRTPGEEKIVVALDYVTGIITKDGQWSKAANFDFDYYRGADRKLTVIQVFDRRDTAGFHWNYTMARSKQRYGSPKSESNGTVIYENRNSRMVLFMGKTAGDNVRFTRDWIAKHERGVVTFRGDSIHLAENMPSDIFGNREGKYVFMIGSCGSAASAPGYVSANPNTDIRTISYISTGYGVVTNVVLSALLDQKRPIGFTELIQSHSAQISAANGEPSLIRVWTHGEGLLAYVSQRTRTMVL